MGIGAIGVVLGHNLRWCDWPMIISLPSRAIAAMVFTEGFLFLSGLGLFFSFDRDNNVRSFLSKRIKRLYLPYLLILLPFAIINLSCGFSSWKSVVVEATCIPWFFGMGGYWYVSLTLFLYLIYPVVHGVIFKDLKKMLPKWCVLMILLYTALITMLFYFPEYFSKVEIGLVKAPMFFVGMLFGYMAKNLITIRYFFPILLVGVILSFGLRFLDFNTITEGISGCMLRLLCMSTICIIIKNNNQNEGIFIKTTSWFGKYSLEIYLLHMMLHRLLLNIANSLDIEGVRLTLLVSLNIPFALFLCCPFQKMTQFILSCGKR